MSKGMILLDDIPECCATPDGMVKCPMAWNTQFCSRFSPKGLDMTNGEWEEIYMLGIKPDWCPIRPIPERAYHEDYWDNGRYDKGWNDCLAELMKEGE